jgi:hypothetical protein
VSGFGENWFMYHDVSSNCKLTVKALYVDPARGTSQNRCGLLIKGNYLETGIEIVLCKGGGRTRTDYSSRFLYVGFIDR